jgi:cytochrome bd-type quinol oxidase subunit 2
MAFVPFWFILITVLWTGFFVLEGFDSASACCTRPSAGTKPGGAP